jgi:hypothetical protein
MDDSGHYYITKDNNDIHMYVETLGYLKSSPLPDAALAESLGGAADMPKKKTCVLDIGMLLKRIGAVSRDVLDCTLPQDIVLAGVDFAPQINAPVYTRIYDSITGLSEFMSGFTDTDDDVHYALAFLIRCEHFIDLNELASLFSWLSVHTDYAFMTGDFDAVYTASDKERMHITYTRTLHVDDDVYTVISFVPQHESV